MADHTEMFDLADITPHWKGWRIARLEAPLTVGFAKLKAQCGNAPCLGFCIISNFDYDTLWDDIPFIQAYATCEEAELDLALKLEEQETKIRIKNPNWPMVSDAPRARQVLPATGSIVPGKFPTQIMGRKYMPYPEASIYVRMYVVLATAQDGALDQLLAMSGIDDEVQKYIEKLGETVAY